MPANVSRAVGGADKRCGGTFRREKGTFGAARAGRMRKDKNKWVNSAIIFWTGSIVHLFSKTGSEMLLIPWDNPKNTPKFGHVSRKCPLFARYPKNAQSLANFPKMPIACGSQKRPEISWANGADDRTNTLHGHKSDPTNGELNLCVCCPSVTEKHTKQHRHGHAPLRQDFERASDEELLK